MYGARRGQPSRAATDCVNPRRIVEPLPGAGLHRQPDMLEEAGILGLAAAADVELTGRQQHRHDRSGISGVGGIEPSGEMSV